MILGPPFRSYTHEHFVMNLSYLNASSIKCLRVFIPFAEAVRTSPFNYISNLSLFLRMELTLVGQRNSTLALAVRRRFFSSSSPTTEELKFLSTFLELGMISHALFRKLRQIHQAVRLHLKKMESNT
uniref:Uncharacterized protein n=1 Tax=Utricularia reniformis TaxID=192314 RepID=A0A1Y0B198_9LAMI|nr:hypothetical protein AEK19_MT0998 [Utricularia reniformis]ART31222.1 hypothetical protein AEK19_MT0998 [Utricularia reniformis]